ncbi:hypothetical protein ANN_05358 [Periplaneta americana]|uniref:Uncharacterized protein n=1 Tax=Periplaneta americana TaxID=6978 RepID=A0ABQ8TAY0_PERAM|nr:hypothetical protein ANN_05358 [Periplaneta americana]
MDEMEGERRTRRLAAEGTEEEEEEEEVLYKTDSYYIIMPKSGDVHYTEEALRNAIEPVRSGIDLNEAARKFGVLKAILAFRKKYPVEGKVSFGPRPVLGEAISCPHGELLRNSRHHKIRSLLASALRGKNYQVEEEVHGLSTNGSTRRIDIIAIPTRSTSGFIIDPTVRMEMYENQPAETLITGKEMIPRDILQELNESSEQYGMKINANTTKTMVIGRKIKKMNVQIRNEAVEQVNSFYKQ